MISSGTPQSAPIVDKSRPVSKQVVIRKSSHQVAAIPKVPKSRVEPVSRLKPQLQSKPSPSAGLSSTNPELNRSAGLSSTTPELNRSAGLNATSPELNRSAGLNATTSELNRSAGLNATSPELNRSAGFNATTSELNRSAGLNTTSSELNRSAGLNATTSEPNRSTGIDSTTSELNRSARLNATSPELNRSAGLNATTSELNPSNGFNATNPELNHSAGFSSTDPERPGDELNSKSPKLNLSAGLNAKPEFNATLRHDSTHAPRPYKYPFDAQQVESLAILLSEGNSRFQMIAEALTREANVHTELFYLNSIVSQQNQVIERLQASSHQHIAAIGSIAANRAKTLTDKSVVFSQVFNYQADGLLDAGFSGVSMIPSTKVLLTKWKKVSPSLKHVAIITGPNNEQQIAHVAAVAKERQVLIQHYVVNNDKEMLYTIDQVAAQVQGFWLLPDNRILSRRGMKNFMSYTMKYGKQVAVFHRKLLNPGGLFYVTADPGYVARQVIKAAKSPPETLLVLDKAQIEVNRRTIERLNLELGTL